MILTGNQSQSGGQMLLATTQGDNQAIKIVGNNVTNQGIASPTKTITLAQAQQMGLLSTNKVNMFTFFHPGIKIKKEH